MIGFAAGLIVVPVAIYVYFACGMAPVATAAQEMPFERLLAKKLSASGERGKCRDPYRSRLMNPTMPLGRTSTASSVQFARACPNDLERQLRTARIQKWRHGA